MVGGKCLQDKLSEHTDSKTVAYLKGIDQAANDLQKFLDQLAAIKGKMPSEGKYESGDGDFLHDMKIDGIKDKPLKLV